MQVKDSPNVWLKHFCNTGYHCQILLPVLSEFELIIFYFPSNHQKNPWFSDDFSRSRGKLIRSNSLNKSELGDESWYGLWHFHATLDSKFLKTNQTWSKTLKLKFFKGAKEYGQERRMGRKSEGKQSQTHTFFIVLSKFMTSCQKKKPQRRSVTGT